MVIWYGKVAENGRSVSYEILSFRPTPCVGHVLNKTKKERFQANGLLPPCLQTRRFVIVLKKLFSRRQDGRFVSIVKRTGKEENTHINTMQRSAIKLLTVSRWAAAVDVVLYNCCVRRAYGCGKTPKEPTPPKPCGGAPEVKKPACGESKPAPPPSGGCSSPKPPEAKPGCGQPAPKKCWRKIDGDKTRFSPKQRPNIGVP